MRKTCVLFGITGLLAAALFSCGDKGTSSNNGPLALDTTVAGTWQGAIGEIHLQNPVIDFNGEKIFVHFSGGNSTFSLITRDSTRFTIPHISDTTLVLTGAWSYNTPKDSVLLVCDTCRIVDTTLNLLVPRQVRGQRIPVFKNIAKNSYDGYIEWEIQLRDFLPIAPLLGLNISTVDPQYFAGTIIVLAKMSQE